MTESQFDACVCFVKGLIYQTLHPAASCYEHTEMERWDGCIVISPYCRCEQSCNIYDFEKDFYALVQEYAEDHDEEELPINS